MGSKPTRVDVFFFFPVGHTLSLACDYRLHSTCHIEIIVQEAVITLKNPHFINKEVTTLRESVNFAVFQRDGA